MSGASRERLPARADVVVIGAGAVGTWCALTLARAGRAVLLLEEREAAATRASFGNAGLITVSAAAPIAAPGVMAQGLRWTLQRRSPVRVRPHASRRWAAWVAQFRRACDAEHAASATAVSLRLVRRSAELLDELASQADDDFAYRRDGLVACFLDAGAHEHAVAGLDRLRALGIDAIVLDGAGARRASPLVGETVVGGVFYPEDAALDPARMVRAALALAVARGAAVHTAVRVERLRPASGGIELETSAGRLVADEVVLSAGFGSGAVLAEEAPLVEAGKGHSDDLVLATPSLGPALRLSEARVVATPLGDRLRVTSRLDLGARDESPVERLANRSLAAAARYLDPAACGPRVRAPWAGLRPMTPDGLPLVGRHPRLPGVVLATGHGHMGIGQAPATAELVAGLLAGDDGPDAAALAPGRFERAAARGGDGA